MIATSALGISFQWLRPFESYPGACGNQRPGRARRRDDRHGEWSGCLYRDATPDRDRRSLDGSSGLDQAIVARRDRSRRRRSRSHVFSRRLARRIVAGLFVRSSRSAVETYRGGRVAVVGAVVILLLVPFYGRMEARIAGQTRGVTYSQNARLPLIKLAWKMIQDRPILGVGANNFSPAVSRYAGPEFHPCVAAHRP